MNFAIAARETERIWFKVSVFLPPEGADLATEQLLLLGAQGAAVQEDGRGKRVVVVGYLPFCPAALDLRRVRENLKLASSLSVFEGEAEVEVEPIRAREWEIAWREGLSAIPVGRRLLVRPPWAKVPPEFSCRLILEIEPGMAFGTGHHVTTRMCLEAVEELVSEGDLVFDIGTGSGILAVGALKLGAGLVVGVDNDYRALKIARGNAKRNGVLDRFEVVAGDLVKPLKGRCDLLVCNIASRAAVEMCSLAKGMVRRIMVLSGISLEGMARVEEAVKCEGWKVLRREAYEGWAVYILRPEREGA